MTPPPLSDLSLLFASNFFHPLCPNYGRHINMPPCSLRIQVDEHKTSSHKPRLAPHDLTLLRIVQAVLTLHSPNISPRQLYISRANRDISSSLFGLKMGRNLQTALAMVDPAKKRDISDRSPFQPRSLKTIFYSSDISLTDGAVHHEIIQH